MFELPDLPDLPSEGTEYTGMADNQVTKTVISVQVNSVTVYWPSFS